jgi:hypothetical protein
VLTRRLALALVLAAGPCVAIAACDDGKPESVNGTPDDAGLERRSPPVEDAEVDADASRPPPTIPGCLGASLPLDPSGERTYVRVPVGGDAGVAVSDAGDAGDASAPPDDDFGSNGSTIDFGAFNPPGPPYTSCQGDAGAPGALCTFADFDFFGSWGQVTLVTADYSFLFNSVRQAGIIGTDFLSVYPFTLDFYDQKILRAKVAEFCTDAQLLASGYSPIPASGFSKLRPLSDVITDPDASTAGFSVPNIPTVPIAIAGVSALAQLDTGYDDRLYRHSININQALFDKIQQQSPGVLSRFIQRDLYLTTCVPGLSQPGRAYMLSDGTAVDFLAEGGSVGRHDSGFMIFVKEALPEADRCGGIETWTVPAAQMGASFLVDAQAAVFDPIHSRVWLPKD